MAKISEKVLLKEYEALLSIWERQPYEHQKTDVWCDMKLNSMLSHFLQASPCVSWVFNLASQRFDFISNNTKEVLGYAPFLFEEKGLAFCNEIKHPEDLVRTWKLIKKIWDFMLSKPPKERALYKFNYDYRIIKPEGKVVRILEQNTVLQQDNNGNITHVLGICNDITTWKKSPKQISSVTSAVDGSTHFFTTEDIEVNNDEQISLSKRELEIVGLLAQGQSSKHIADQLSISFHTVNTHRQNMIEKTNERHDYSKADLTKRETEIVTLIASGFNNPQIAEKLAISRYTVEQHRKNINRKLETKSVVDLVFYAQKEELV